MIELTPQLLKGVIGGFEEDMIGRDMNFEKADRVVEEEEEGLRKLKEESASLKTVGGRVQDVGEFSVVGTEAPVLPAAGDAVVQNIEKAEVAPSTFNFLPASQFRRIEESDDKLHSAGSKALALPGAGDAVVQSVAEAETASVAAHSKPNSKAHLQSSLP